MWLRAIDGGWNKFTFGVPKVMKWKISEITPMIY